MKETRLSNSALKSVCKSCSKKPCEDLHWKDVVVCTDYFAAPIECPLKITDEHSIRFAFNRFSDYEVSVLAGSVWTQHNFGSRRNSGTNGKAEGINHIIAHMRQNKCVVLSKYAAPGYQPWVLLGGWGNTSFDGLFFSNETGPVKEEAALTDDLEVIDEPIEISNPQWVHTDEELLEYIPEKAVEGNPIQLSAQVKNYPEGASVTFDIFDATEGTPMRISTVTGKNEGGTAIANWTVTDPQKQGDKLKLVFEAGARNKLTPKADIPYFPKLDCNFVEMPDILFNHGSAVPCLDSEGVLVGAVTATFIYAKNNPGQEIVLFGHADTSGDPGYNTDLSGWRAEGIKALCDNDVSAFLDIVDLASKVEDFQTILKSLADGYGWATDPGAVDNIAGEHTKTALAAFQEGYNSKFGGSLAVDGKIGPQTWEALFTVQRSIIEDTVKEECGEIPELTYGYDGTGIYPCGESFPTDAVGKDNYKSKVNRRVETTFFEVGKSKEVQPPKDPNKVHGLETKAQDKRVAVDKPIKRVAVKNEAGKKQCELTTFTIKDKHSGGRNLVLDVLKGAPTRDKQYVLQVVSDYKKFDKITIAYDGKCDIKPFECPKLLIDNEIQPEGEVTLECAYDASGIKTDLNLVSFIKETLTLKHYYKPLKKYNISVKSCNVSKNCFVEVYPYAKWEGAVTLGYEHDKDKGSQGWKIEPTLKIYEGTKHDEYSLLPSVAGDFFSGVQNFLGKFLGRLYEIKAVAKVNKRDFLEVTPPKIKLGGAMEIKELDDSYKVVKAGEITLAFDPFIGLKGTVDLLDFLLNTLSKTGTPAGGFALVLKTANDAYREKNKDRIGNKTGVHFKEGAGAYGVEVILKLDFTVEGTLNGDVTWKTTDGKTWTSEGKIDAKLELKIEGKAHMASSVFVIKVGAGLTLGGNSVMGIRFKLLNDGKVTFKPEAYFDGLFIYYSYYAEVGAKKEADSNNESWIPPEPSVDSVTHKEEHKGKVEVIGAGQYPDSKELIINLENGKTS